MKGHLTTEQIKKLIQSNDKPDYSILTIGELISLLPHDITRENIRYHLNIMPWKGEWLVRYSDLEGSSLYIAQEDMLPEALYMMCVLIYRNNNGKEK